MLTGELELAGVDLDVALPHRNRGRIRRRKWRRSARGGRGRVGVKRGRWEEKTTEDI
jgi:hypothetical protein